MSEAAQVVIAPVAGKARIDVLDVMRGIAILGIFFMNIPFMGFALAKVFVDVRLYGWTLADQASWTAVQVLLEGTQRGLLELLFGAGMMVLTARAMSPDGPVAIADLYFRRNLWLLFFGFVDIFLLLWAGDILHIYALAAMFLFPFRKLGPKLLLTFGLGFAAFVLVSGGIKYAERTELIARVEAVHAKQTAKTALTDKDKKTLEEWKKKVENRQGRSEDFKQIKEQEPKGHAGGLIPYAMWNIGSWLFFVAGSLLQNVFEAFCVMLIGIALWKWQVIQGGRSTRFYLVLMLVCYAIAVPLRLVGAWEQLPMEPNARIGWFSYEVARILMTLGHVGLINLAMQGGVGRAILAPFRAAGRTAFSLYFLQQIIGMWVLFAPWGPGLWDKLSWGGLYSVAVAVIVGELLLANLWLLFFTSGPLEWVWRSLAYVRRQPLLRRRPPEPEGAGPAA